MLFVITFVFFLFIETKMIVLKELMAKGINYLKVLSKVITSLSVEKSLYGQPVDSDVKRYKEIRMSTTGKRWRLYNKMFFFRFCMHQKSS